MAPSKHVPVYFRIATCQSAVYSHVKMTVFVEAKVPALKSVPALDENNRKNMNQGVLNELKELSRYFSQLIDTIPPKVYFNKNEDIMEKIEVNKRAVFEDSNLSNKAKNKRIKLDPNAHKKISDIANVYYEKKKNDGKMSELRKKLAKRIKELRQARGAQEHTKASRTNSESSQNSPIKNGESVEKLPKIYNKDGNLVFSKFDFASHVDVAVEKELEKSKQKKDSLRGLLVKAKKEDDKIARLEKTDSEAASKLKEKKMWKSALEKCEGNKVRDNPKLLEKSVNKKHKLKVKSAKAWAERKETVEKRLQKRQDIRQKHINERKQQNRDKKMKILKKRGRIPN